MNARTEKDARTKWCPFVRYVPVNAVIASVNRWEEFSNPAPCRCIASQCMVWQWVEPYAAPELVNHAGARGYCGLAGR